MSIPRRAVFIRHGQSEANVVQETEKRGEVHPHAEAVRARPDWQQRLTDYGYTQGDMAGAWLENNLGGVRTFDARYASPYIRTRETAVALSRGVEVQWRSHQLIHERDWGHFGRIPRADQPTHFPLTHKFREASPLYARLDGGEALADDVAVRVKNYRAMLKAKWAGKSVLTVTHGDVISVVRYTFEDMLPEEWEAIDADKSQRIGNCAILEYVSLNPNDETDERPYFAWRRMVNPVEPEASPFGGEWQELPDRRFRMTTELQASVDAYPPLLS